jgi:hypothetical protein
MPTKSKSPEAEIRLALVPLDQLAPLKRNVRKSHRVHALAASMKMHGFGQAITVNRTTGHTIAGNGRVKALAHLRRASAAPPPGITIGPRNQWMVPVYFGTWTVEAETAVALALNGGLNHSLEGEWDAATIAELMEMAKPPELEALNVPAQQAEQYTLDFETPLEEPVINLEGLDRVAIDEGLTTVRLKCTERMAARVAELVARGVTAAEILTHGLETLERKHHDVPHERRRRSQAAAQVEQHAPGAQARARPKGDRRKPARRQG